MATTDRLHPTAELAEIRSARMGDPTWMLVLRAIALVLAIILMLLLLLGGIGLYQRMSSVDDIFEDTSSTDTVEPTSVPEEPFTPTPGPGQTEESIDWYQTNEDGSESYCYTTPEPYEEICEPTGN